MRTIGILADYLTKSHKEKLEKAALENGFVIRYFSNVQEAESAIHECEILYGYYPAALLKKAASLRWFHTASAGVDAFLSEEVYPHPGVYLTNSNGSYGITISEHIVMVLLMMMRLMPEYSKLMEEHDWRRLGDIRSIYGSSFVVVGTGDIGTNVARRLKALGAATVIGVRRSLGKPLDPSFDGVTTLENLKEACQEKDAVILCVPATSETKGLLSKEIIDSLAPSCYVVNVGRGSAIDQDALIAALNEDRIAGAALDVVTPEPLPKDAPLYDAKHLVLTPHISGTMALSHTCDINVDIFIRNLKRYVRGESLHHLVDRKIGY